MNLINQMMSYDKTKTVNQKCDCEECVKVENRIIEYPPLTEEEIEQIIKERYEYKDEKTKIFIRKALRVHGDRYDYSNSVYTKAIGYVEIICRVEGHKPFPQTPNNHYKGKGCPMCKGKKKLTLKEVIERANKIHGVGRYDYSKSVYINYNTDMIIICHNHETPYEFSQTPHAHLRGQGCPICKGGVKLNTEEFIKKANEKQGYGTYDYSKVEYINVQTEVIIICPIHGEFSQTPRDHLSGKGCSKCNKNKGEESIRRFLTEKGIEFQEQKKFKGCKYKRELRFDFYLPKYNLCIESDGNVHFEQINWGGKCTEEEMKERLKNTQHRDNIKNEYCKKNNITLLRVNNLRAYEEVEKYFQDNNLLK